MCDSLWNHVRYLFAQSSQKIRVKLFCTSKIFDASRLGLPAEILCTQSAIPSVML